MTRSRQYRLYSVLLVDKAARPPQWVPLVRRKLRRTTPRGLRTPHRCRSSRPRPQCRCSRHLWLHQNTSPVPLVHASHPSSLPVESRQTHVCFALRERHRLTASRLSRLTKLSGCPLNAHGSPRGSISVFSCQRSLRVPGSPGRFSGVVTLPRISGACNFFPQKSERLRIFPGGRTRSQVRSYVEAPYRWGFPLRFDAWYLLTLSTVARLSRRVVTQEKPNSYVTRSAWLLVLVMGDASNVREKRVGPTYPPEPVDCM